MRYIIIGSALSGNKGAASMLEASIQSISEQDKAAKFVLFSLYPKEDKLLNNYSNLEILSTSPLTLALKVVPLSFLYSIIAPIRPLLLKDRHIKNINTCNAYLDQVGISFVDGREKFLIYNIAVLLPAIFMKKPVIKCSQALGPFNNTLNRILAKIFLKKLNHVFARGYITKKYLSEIGITNLSSAADYAFLMRVNETEKFIAKKVLKKGNFKSNERNVGIYPSVIMRDKLEKGGKDYVGMLANFIDKLAKENISVYLIPHSQRFNIKKVHNNDLAVCRDIFSTVKVKERCTLVDDNLSAQQLRYIIGRMDFNVAARFHAMVSSLSVRVPVLVTGWNHKYEEVLDEFGVLDCSISLSDMTGNNLYNKFIGLYDRRLSIKKKISENLPKVRINSMKNTDYIVRTAKDDKKIK